MNTDGEIVFLSVGWMMIARRFLDNFKKRA